MALQELDLHIHYRPGKRNANADALSRTLSESVSLAEPSEPPVVLAAIQPGEDLSKGGDDCLEKRQHQDPELTMIMEYLQAGTVPKDSKKVWELILTQSQYELVDGVLYHVEADKTRRIIWPTGDRKQIYEEVHAGTFGGHLRETKIHGQLSKHYWWPRMRADIRSRACLTCATQHVGRAAKSPLPVAGPFDCVGVDVKVSNELSWKLVCRGIYGLSDEMAGGSCYF